jgi:O-methyltransferase involved in polyketide biosynthesis
MVARFRDEYTDMPYSHEIFREAKRFKGSGMLSLITPILLKFVRKSSGALERLTSLEGRYLSINLALKKFGKCDVVELACGLSGRGLEFSEKGRFYVETDLKDMLELKKQVVKSIGKNNTSLKFMKLDVLSWTDFEKLGRLIQSSKRKNPVVFVNEGLVIYLTKEEQKVARDNIVRFLRTYSPRGAWITTDFSTFRNKDRGLVGFSKKLIQLSTRRKFTHFKDDSEVTNFLNEGGLSAKVLDNSEVIRHFSCLKKRNFDLSKVRASMEGYRPWIARLDPKHNP